jgi:phospholipid/cholesterol/gamma-HCH transport system ATP-binding protein
MKEAIIKIRNLTARYEEETILENISVDIYPREVTVILGPSGCGKTTLLRNILRLKQPAEGFVEIFGQNITTMEEGEYEAMLKKFGVLFQNGALLNSIDIYENISIPFEQHTRLPRKIIDRSIRVKLELVNLSKALYLKPSELSGGMRKRAALARAIALDPEILFCDEPSAGLDPLTSSSLDELILDLKRQLDMTLVIVTHELASIHRIADKIIYLDKGRMLFHGSVAEAKSSDVEEVREFFRIGAF